MKHKIALVGEAWGEHEERQRMPFVGPSGYHLNQMLQEAGIDRTQCFITNVFNLRPKPTNDIHNLCGDKSSGIPGRGALSPGKYVRKEFAGELARLFKELDECRANVIVALGGTAAWAILGQAGISKLRGTVTGSIYGKVLCTYHPAAVLRDWSLRPVTVMDLMKAKRESEFPELRRPERYIWLEPTIEDLEVYYRDYLVKAEAIAFDIETAGDQITCIGFSPGPSSAIVVPFTDPRRASGSYWGTLSDEVTVWKWVRRVLDLPCPKIAQNGLYDINFLWRGYGIPVRNFVDDTMLLHHSLHPEAEKGLGFLGSVYTNEPAWKLMRPRGKGTIKKDA